MDARGQVGELTEWIPRLIVLLISVIIVAMLVRQYADRDVDASIAHRAAYLARLERDPSIYAWSDPASGRATPGVIDAAKLTQGRIDTTYGTTGSIASHVRVTGSCLATPFEDYNDKTLYDAFIALAGDNVKGAGGATMERWMHPVTIVNAGQRCDGLLLLTVVTPNTPHTGGAS